VTEGMGKTGVFGALANGHGPVVWFGADMDSNSVRVATGQTRLRTGCSYRATAGRRDLERAWRAPGGLHVDNWAHGAD